MCKQVRPRLPGCGGARWGRRKYAGAAVWREHIRHAQSRFKSCLSLQNKERRKTMSVNLIETIENLGIPEVPEERERFKIESKDQAAWALRKMSRIKAEIEENNKVAQAEIERITAWRDEENEKLQRSISFFESLLCDYFLRLRESDPKLKTIKLPHGTLKMRAQQPQYEYDEDVLLPWAKENLPEAVVTKESVAKNPVKKHIQETGEAVPGVTIIERPEKFSVEVV